MYAQRKRELQPLRIRLARALALAIALALVAALLWPTASAQRRERTGKEVVETVCLSCHEKGVNSAPRIGDAQAWAARASQGLAALSEHALKGIRNMPAHGGDQTLSDIEIERAVTYMVNQSGGHWVEPLGGATPAVVRSGERIVQTHCSKCHQEGLNGAPKIGDRVAWAPRLNKGLDAVVRSAVHGHGAMPARGGVADLSDLEMQGAVVYMFNYGVAAAPAAPPAAAAVSDPYHKVVAGTDIYLGIVRAEAVPESHKQSGLPRGKGYYHLNISLFDAKTKAAINDAQVRVKVADPTGAETKTLKPMATNNAVSYGGYFRMLGANPYTITARVQRPGVSGSTEAKFEYRVW